MTGTSTRRLWSADAPSLSPLREVRLEPVPVDREIETFPKAARDLVAEHLPRWGLTALVEDAQLVASELVTIAVKCVPHGTVGFALKYTGDALRIEVEDTSPTEPLLRRTSSEAESGRGLQLVMFLSDKWGFHKNSNDTKMTWCLFCTGPAADSDRG